MKDSITIKSSRDEVLPFVDEVRKSADQNKDALGFFAAPVYEIAANDGNLFVAASDTNGKDVYAGHLLFGGAFPHAKIFQVFVVPAFQRQGIGRKLLQSLIVLMEQHSFLQISAGVASDLTANEFYQKMGFEVSRTRAGGATRKRTINVRVRQLNTSDLFKLSANACHEPNLTDRLANRQPVYVIDLNVFWDVVKRRPRSKYATALVGAAFRRLINLVITSEFVRELERNSQPSFLGDPALEFAAQLPILQEPEQPLLDNLINELGSLVFPYKARTGSMSVRDHSDLVHLATAIHHSVNAFVTGEDAILRASDALNRRYGLEVVHVEELSAVLSKAQKPIPSFRAQLSSSTLYILSPVTEKTSTIEAFLQTTSASISFRNEFLPSGAASTSRHTIAVTSGTEIVTLASWDANASLLGRADVRLVANEEHAAVRAALDCIVGQLCKHASQAGPTLLRLTLLPGQVECKQVALMHGFQPIVGDTNAESTLQKVCIGGPVTAKNWTRVRKILEQCSGLVFPQSFPLIVGEDVSIPFLAERGVQGSISLSRLEKMFSPTLLALPNRNAAIAPIRRGYAEQLLEGAPQMSLTPNESGGDRGRACVTAVVRVVQTEIHNKADIPAQMLRQGVVDPDGLQNITSGGTLAVTTFDNVLILDRPVRLDRLREIELRRRVKCRLRATGRS